MTKKKTLLDLYVVGKELVFDDGSGDEVKVWLQKLSPLDHETAVRKSNAARARLLLCERDPEGDELKAVENELLDEHGDDVDSLIQVLIARDLIAFGEAREAEYAAEPEWSEDNYLQGLHDAWNDGLSDLYATTPDDPEAKRVHAEMQRFTEKVSDAIAKKRRSLESAYDGVPFDEIWAAALKEKLRSHADMAWLLEFRRCEAWLSVRDPSKHNEYYFSSRDDVDRLAPPVLRKLVEEYVDLELTVTEGKD